MRLRTSPHPQSLLENSDNLHRIAISNLTVNVEAKLSRWWAEKYRTPAKPFLEYTTEELVIMYLEDHYEKNPVEMQKFLSPAPVEDEWDGVMSQEYERAMEGRLKRVQERTQVDLSKYQDSKPLTQAEEDEILKNLGLPQTEGEFEDNFED